MVVPDRVWHYDRFPSKKIHGLPGRPRKDPSRLILESPLGWSAALRTGSLCRTGLLKRTFLYIKIMLLAIGMRNWQTESALERDEFFMGLAFAEAEKGCAQAEVPVGAVLVGADGQVLSREHNRPISSNDPTGHAEILAIRSASARVGNYRLPETTLYVTLEPCVMCVGAMVHARVKRLVFGAPDPRSGAAGSVLDLTGASCFNHRIDVTGGVLAGRCAEILRAFFEQRRG